MTKIAQINGYTIAYNQIGHGPLTAVLVHGWGASKAWWCTIAAGLADTHTCYIIDLLGFGESAKPTRRDAFHIEHQAARVADFIEQLEVGPVYLIGHSMGGMISVTLAYHYPHLVDRLAVFNLVVTGRCGSFLRLGQLTLALPLIGSPLYSLGLWFSKQTPPAYDRVFTTMLADPVTLKQPHIRAYIDHVYPDFLTTPTYSYKSALLAFTSFDLRPLMADVSHPTLIVCGQVDRLIPAEDSEILAQGMPHARLERVPAAGHNPFVEYPDRCIGLLREFSANHQNGS
jgi:pimeloyl-ACP methyl ester carboxylesterase